MAGRLSRSKREGETEREREKQKEKQREREKQKEKQRERERESERIKRDESFVEICFFSPLQFLSIFYAKITQTKNGEKIFFLRFFLQLCYLIKNTSEL